MADDYQNIIIGTGEAGKYLSWALARQGQPTIAIERSLVGGACPNVACLPTKNVIYSAKVADLVAHAASYGEVIRDSSVDMAGVRRRKQEMIDGLQQLHLKNFRESGAELLMGSARFTQPKTIVVELRDGGERTLRGERVFLSVGSRASLPNLPGLAEAQPLTHVEALDLAQLPAHLVILGGGYVGLEFAQAMRRFGSRVTVIQRGPHLLDREDPEFGEAILQILRGEGIEVLLNTSVDSVAGRSGDGVQLKLRSAAGATSLDASHLLVSTGRTPNADLLDVARGGVELDSHGYIHVNERLETTAPGVWAMGDCAGSPQFTHVSYDDFRVVRDNLAGGNRTTRDRIIPYCLFTDPELAHVGLTEMAARANNVSYRLLKLPMVAIMRTRTHGDIRGMIKALIGDDDCIIGFTALGVEASELMAAAHVAMVSRLPYQRFREGIYAHPTTAEGLTALFAMDPVPAS